MLHELQVHQVELELQNAELLQAREAEAGALEKYSDLYDFAPVGYLSLDRQGTILAANLTGSVLLGVERSCLIGRRFGQFIAAGSRSVFADFLAGLFRIPAKATCELALQKTSDAGLFVQIEGLAAAEDECRIVLIDISERTRAVEALRLAKEASEVQRLTNEATKVLYIANVETEVLRLTKEATEALHQANEATEALLLATEAAEALRLANEAAKALRLAKEAAESLRLVNEATEERLLAKEAAKMLRLANEAAEALRLAKEAAVALRLAKEAALALRLAKESAEASARTKSQFFANMSHELRTPMTGILGLLQLALAEELAPLPREYLETTLTSARCLLQILNDILDMAKIEAGKFTIHVTPFILQKCLDEAVAISTPEARRKGLDFAISAEKDVPEMVYGDQARLRQVLLNLIGNALKFTEEGKVTLHVSAGRLTCDGKRELIFTVTDTGIGIPGDKQELLFRAFSQVDASHSRSFGGAGLGLVICREIVELMGGTIAFESKEGLGSRFSFSIPLAEAGLEDDLPPATPSLAAVKTVAQEGERIPRLLLAEDDSTIRQVLGAMLKMATNFDFDIAEDGLKAVELWEKGAYDLVLMDVQMPRLDGYQATRTIRDRELERGGHTPVIAMTAHASKEDEERCLEAGMDAFIPKPIDFARTLQAIREILNR
jgi:signal transduction histidine kinase